CAPLCSSVVESLQSGPQPRRTQRTLSNEGCWAPACVAVAEGVQRISRKPLKTLAIQALTLHYKLQYSYRDVRYDSGRKNTVLARGGRVAARLGTADDSVRAGAGHARGVRKREVGQEPGANASGVDQSVVFVAD